MVKGKYVFLIALNPVFNITVDAFCPWFGSVWKSMEGLKVFS